MKLTALDVRDVRIVASAAIEPGPTMNVIVGPNAAGKTSVLEAIHLLATGRSFAAARAARLVRTGAGPLRVVGRVAGVGGAEHRIGIERAGSGAPRLRMDGRNVERIADLARTLPVIAVHPGSHELVAGGPAERRRLVDFGLFHAEPGFHEVWQRYRRAIAQRNALLRAGRADRELAPWEGEAGSSGEQLHAFRAAYVRDLEPRVRRLGARVATGMETLEVAYRPGWQEAGSLADALAQGRRQDRERLVTTRGPHRADLQLRIEGHDVRQRISRGQQKLLAYVLRLAQAEQLERSGCALLLDDLPAELDRERRAAVLELAVSVGAQVFVTALEVESLPGQSRGEARVFHVEQGRVSEMLQ
jgi:DNA replication and repair protein RecF